MLFKGGAGFGGQGGSINSTSNSSLPIDSGMNGGAGIGGNGGGITNFTGSSLGGSGSGLGGAANNGGTGGQGIGNGGSFGALVGSGGAGFGGSGGTFVNNHRPSIVITTTSTTARSFPIRDYIVRPKLFMKALKNHKKLHRGHEHN